ncbi:MAG: hypothetical protein SF097_02685 [Acidobacteriota bacterium]|nr:hypothetical protein [Acidobacteriota bacterium]
MTTITLEVPDELAAQVVALGGRLPDLLARALKSEPVAKRRLTNGAGVSIPLYREITDFLASNPSPEQVAAFKISGAAQKRLEDLLDKNREDVLTAAETAELDAYLQARDLMILLKADS